MSLSSFSIARFIHIIYTFYIHFFNSNFFFVFRGPIKYGQQTNNFLSPA